MRRILPVGIAILLLTAGCGGSDDLDPATTTAAATIAPASSLIDYGDEIALERAADVSKLTGAPQDFKTFIAAELARQQATKDDVCTEEPEIHVAKIDIRGWAAGGSFIPQCGGNAALWAKAAAGWQEVWSGQTLPDCAILEKYRFPATVAGSECGTDDGRTRRYPA